jgi:hypothetical protein
MDTPLARHLHSELRRRSTSVVESSSRSNAVLDKTWIQIADTGYCHAEIVSVGDEFCIFIHSGLTSMVRQASFVVAAHFRDGLYEDGAVTDEHSDWYRRMLGIYVGQLHLFGLIRYHLPTIRRGARLVDDVAIEAMLYIVAHEASHAIAGHFGRNDDAPGFDTDEHESLHSYSNEIEADALASIIWMGDFWGATVTEGDIQLRLLAARVAFHVLELAEDTAIFPTASRHLPAELRWSALESSLENDIESEYVQRLAEQWKEMRNAIEIHDSFELRPPGDSIVRILKDEEWIDAELGPEEDDRWSFLESASYHLRLHPVLLRILVGHEALYPQAELIANPDEEFKVGKRIIDDIAVSLPRWLKGGGKRNLTATSSDLISYLRDRDNWCEPFRSDGTLTLPIHIVAAAIARIVKDAFAAEAKEQITGEGKPPQ